MSAQAEQGQPLAGGYAWPFKYEIIDGLRGIAAVLVVMHHVGIAALGHFAVVLFFVISGYCISASAESARRRGTSFISFMKRRFHRIYPPYFLAIVFYIVTRVVKVISGGHNDLARSWTDWLQNLTLTQWVTLPFHPVTDAPQNPKLLVTAFWSLNYEEQFYGVMAVALVLAIRRGIPIPVTVLVLGAAGLAWNCTVPDGWITGIFLEYWAQFAVGAGLFYALSLAPNRAARFVFPLLVVMLGSYCVSQVTSWRLDTDPYPRAYAELAVATAFALFLFFARPVSAWLIRQYWWQGINGLGAISYSLYLVHQFNLMLVANMARHVVPEGWANLERVVSVALHIVIAALFWYACERPFLNRTPAGRRALAAMT